MSERKQTLIVDYTVTMPGTESESETPTSQFDEQLDARGLSCPLPILKAKQRLNELESGSVLMVLADDPGSVKDFQAFSRQTGNELLESRELADHYSFLLRKQD